MTGKRREGLYTRTCHNFSTLSSGGCLWLAKCKIFPGGSEGEESACDAGDLGSIPGLGRFPWRRAWQPPPEFLPGECAWTEQPGGLRSTGWQRVRHGRAAKHTSASSGSFPIPQTFPADAAGDLPDGGHHHAAGKVHHGQGVPAEGGPDEAGVPDPAPKRGAVQGPRPVQVSRGGGWSRELGLENGPSPHQETQVYDSIGHWVGVWSSEDSLGSLPSNGGHPSALPPSQPSEDGFVGLCCSVNPPSQ